jgi:hypothetical protein
MHAASIYFTPEKVEWIGSCQHIFVRVLAVESFSWAIAISTGLDVLATDRLFAIREESMETKSVIKKKRDLVLRAYELQYAGARLARDVKGLQATALGLDHVVIDATPGDAASHANVLVLDDCTWQVNHGRTYSGGHHKKTVYADEINAPRLQVPWVNSLLLIQSTAAAGVGTSRCVFFQSSIMPVRVELQEGSKP